MAYSDNFPATRPVFQADFANGGRIDPRASYSRSTTGTYFGTEKVLSSENLLLQSENFTTTWSTQDSNGSAGATAPDGGTDAYTVTAHTGSSKGPRVSQSLSGKLSTSTQYTMVGHVKAGTATHGYISFRGNNSNNYAYAQIEFASPSSVSTGGVGFSGISGTVTALGSSWYRLTLTATTGSDVSGAFAFLGVNDGTAFGISGYPAWTSAGETLEVWGAQLSTTQTKVYDSPTTTQIARSYQTKLQTAAINAPRFEYSATDGESAGTSLGILIEGQSQNLLSYSNDFSNAAWSKVAATASLEGIGPDGQLSAYALREDTAGGNHLARQIATIGSGSVAFSIYAKLLGNTRRLVLREGTTTGAAATFDLATGTVAAWVSGATGSIESVGNGWYRCTMVCSPGAGAKNFEAWVVTSTATNWEAYTGDGYSGLLLFGAQVEDSSFSSSFILSNGSATTRAADSLSVATSSFGLTGGPVSYVAEVGAAKGYFPAVLSTTYGSNSFNEVAIQKLNAAAGESTEYSYVGGDGSVTTHSFSISGSGDSTVVAVASDTNRFAGVADGGTVTTDTNGALPQGVDTLYIGSFKNSYGHINTNVKRIAVFGEALSDTNLISLTK